MKVSIKSICNTAGDAGSLLEIRFSVLISRGNDALFEAKDSFNVFLV